MKKRKLSDIENSIDENVNETLPGIDENIHDNYGVDFYSEGIDTEPWSVLRMLREKNELMHVSHVIASDGGINCLMAINFNVLSEGNTLDLIFKINSLFHDENVVFLRIVSTEVERESYEEFFVKDDRRLSKYVNFNTNSKKDFYKIMDIVLFGKGLERFTLALNI